MKPMTHNQYVHYLIQQMDAHNSPEQAHATPKRKKTTLSTSSPHVEVQATSEPLQMKALSIRQPYAGLIIAGIKNVENRSWNTKFTGLLVICATKSPDALKWWGPMRDKCKRLGVIFPEALCKINGAVLGVVDFNYQVWTAEDGSTNTDHPTISQEALMDWWDDDSVGFILEHPRQLLSPIPVTGRLGLFDLPEDVAVQIKKQLQ